jgi:putative hydrolase of the HAD superfamily
MTTGDLRAAFAGADTVLLDAGGVLVNPNWARVSAALAARGVTASAERLETAEAHAKRELDEPAQIAATDDDGRGWLYFDLVLRHAGVAAPAATIHSAWSELRAYHARTNLWETIAAGVPDALARLRASGRRLAVVSNANGTLRAHFDRLGLAGFFDVVLDSTEVGLEKPDPRLFEVALMRSGARAAATVHVGDLYHVDVVGARAAGLRAVLVDPAGLYVGHDCARARSLSALVEQVEG